MRVLRSVLYGVCVSLGGLSSALGACYATVDGSHDPGPNGLRLYMLNYGGANHAFPASPDNGVTVQLMHNDGNYSFSAVGASWVIPANCGTYWVGNDGTVTQWTNKIYVARVQWTNSGVTWAVTDLGVVQADGSIVYPTNLSSTAVAPGNWVDFYVTNGIPGTVYYGNSRAGNTVAPALVTPTEYTVASVMPGTGGGTAGQVQVTPIAGSSASGTSTGAATTRDVLTSSEANIQALAAVERAVRDVGQQLAGGVFTNVPGVGNDSNTLNRIEGNTRGSMTNDIDRLAEVRGWEQSWMANGVYDQFLATSNMNWITRDLQVVNSNLNFASSVSGSGDGMLGLGGANPTVEWGVLPLCSFTPGFDIRRVLDGSVLEDPKSVCYPDPPAMSGVTGIRRFLRVLLMWGIVVGMIFSYSGMLREGLLEVLHTPSFQTDALALGAGSSVPGANFAYRWGMFLILVGVLMFLPSLIVTIAGTAFSFLTEDGSGGLAAAATVVAGGPLAGAGPGSFIMAGLSNCWTLLNSWLPLRESVVYAINMGIAYFTVNQTVCWMALYTKAMG